MWRLTLRNPWTFAGLLLAGGAGMLHLTLLVTEVVMGTANPYLNIAFHLVLPVFVFLGLVLIAIGVVRTRRRVRRGELVIPEKGKIPVAGVIGGLVTTFALLIPFLAFTGYSGYQYSESVEFCGQACHLPMGPTFTTYQHSPHASVPCADCHVGEGAWWFVRAKLNGTRQLWSMLTDSFPRPIPTPLEHMRPAGDICKNCHWAEKPHGERLIRRPHFASDEANSPRPVHMTLDLGRTGSVSEPARGIHWHAATDAHFVEYVATDSKRLQIPWVRTNVAGESIVYRSDGLPSDAPPPKGELRVMDCMDCHNRPAHQGDSPQQILDRLLYEGSVASLPFLKREAVALLSAEYETGAEAEEAIRSGLTAYYTEHYPALAQERPREVEAAADAIAEEYALNLFPEMRTDWRVRPNHIGHLETPGCQRCHGGQHQSDGGQVIGSDCRSCHTFMNHPGGTESLVPGDYVHPMPLAGTHAGLACASCHDGGSTPPNTCEGCHAEIDAFVKGELREIASLIEVTPGKHHDLACEDCHAEPERVDATNRRALCLECHDDEIGDVADEWHQEIDGLFAAARNVASKEGRAALEVLDRVGPLHDFEQARALLEWARRGK